MFEMKSAHAYLTQCKCTQSGNQTKAPHFEEDKIKLKTKASIRPVKSLFILSPSLQVLGEQPEPHVPPRRGLAAAHCLHDGGGGHHGVCTEARQDAGGRRPAAHEGEDR